MSLCGLMPDANEIADSASRPFTDTNRGVAANSGETGLGNGLNDVGGAGSSHTGNVAVGFGVKMAAVTPKWAKPMGPSAEEGLENRAVVNGVRDTVHRPHRRR